MLLGGVKGAGGGVVGGGGTRHRPSHDPKSDFCLLRKKKSFSWKSSCSNNNRFKAAYIKKNSPRHPPDEDEIYAYLTDELYIKPVCD